MGAVAAAILLTAGSLFVWLPWARASVGQTVGDGQAVALDGTFSPAEVGRLPELAGPGFATTSVTAAFYGQVSTTSGNYVPALAGDELLYLSVNLYSFAPPLGNSALTYEADFAPALTVNFAGSSVPLPQAPRGSIKGVAGSKYGEQGELYSGQWLVALPKNAPVTLSATENGFTQSIDVRNATRVGETPTVLYRSSSGPLALDVRGNLAATLVVDAGGNQVRFPVTLKEAFLGFFDLSSVDDTPAAAPGEAYLFAQVSIGAGVDGQGRADWYLDPSAPGQAVTVAVDGGAPETAARSPAAPGPHGVGHTGSPSGGLFGFLVPAGVTSATVVVNTGPDPSVYYQGPNDNAATVEGGQLFDSGDVQSHLPGRLVSSGCVQAADPGHIAGSHAGDNDLCGGDNNTFTGRGRPSDPGVSKARWEWVVADRCWCQRGRHGHRSVRTVPFSPHPLGWRPTAEDT